LNNETTIELFKELSKCYYSGVDFKWNNKNKLKILKRWRESQKTVSAIMITGTQCLTWFTIKRYFVAEIDNYNSL
jgi:uncharacterized protein YjdB